MTTAMDTIWADTARPGRDAGRASAADTGCAYSPSIAFHSLVNVSWAAM
jgi:hypothetical protein